MIYCPVCGTANREGSRFCNQCGARLAEEPIVHCSRCGAANAPGATHCENCGLSLAGEAATERSPQEAGPPEGLPAAIEGPPDQASGREATTDERQPSAVRSGGLPPWLDAAEGLEEETGPEATGEEEAERFEARSARAEWSADAIPIEPIVGVPYRAHQRSELPPTAEQRAAAELFAATAAEEDRIAPQELPSLHRARRSDVAWRWLIAFALLFALLVPLIWSLAPFNVVAAIPAPVADAAQAIEELPSGSPVLVAFDYDAGLAGELEPIAESYLRHLLSQDARVLLVSTQPEGAALADMALDHVLADYPSVRYGETVLNLGYVAGGEAGIRTLGADLAAAAPTDWRQGQPLAGYPLMAGITRGQDLPLIVVLGGDLVSVQRWIEQFGSPYSTPLVAGVPALIEPAVGPYRTAGQLRGVVAGLGGAAAYERLQTRVGPAGRMLAALRIGLWVVAGLVVLVNLVALLDRLRRRRA